MIGTAVCARVTMFAALIIAATQAAAQPLPPPPVPPQNPITEQKRVLGKILFWEEQLSSDNTVACGTCHISTNAGSDPRLGRNPGVDNVFNTPDDKLGSPGVAHMNSALDYIDDSIFGFDVQVTRRNAQSVVGSAFSANAMFWDGRAPGVFVNPETAAVSIPNLGALESQAVQPILSAVEMGHDSRNWTDVRNKLQSAAPLALAGQVPPDMANAVAANPSYPALFAAAFGTPAITGERIAFAIATYERTLIPNQTPFDGFLAGNPNALTPAQQQGRNLFVGSGRCNVCHTGSVLSNQTFRNIGLRPPPEDAGRREVTGNPADRGRFKVPALRNVGFKTRFMHNGQLSTLRQVVDFYGNAAGQFPDNRDPIMPTIILPLPQRDALVDFLQNGLTDPRVAAGQFPFDRPRLRSEMRPGDVDGDGSVDLDDLARLLAAYGTCTGQPSFTPAADFDRSGCVDLDDLATLLSNFG